MRNRYIQRQTLIRKHRSFFVGLFVLIPLIIVPMLLVMSIYKIVNVEFVDGWCNLFARYENCQGLSKGNPVVVSGMTIGHIQDMTLEKEKKILVHFKIRKRYMTLVKKDTKALLRQKNAFVGDYLIELKGGSDHDSSVNNNDTLGSEMPVGIEKTIDQVMNTVTLVQDILREIIDGKGTVGKLIREDSIARNFSEVEKNFSHLTIETTGAIKRFDSLLAVVKDAANNSNNIVDTIQLIVNKVHTAINSANAILENVNDASVNIPQTVEKVNEDLDEAAKMMRAIEQGWLFRRIAKTPPDPTLDKAP